jgi:hypothetical protein
MRIGWKLVQLRLATDRFGCARIHPQVSDSGLAIRTTVKLGSGVALSGVITRASLTLGLLLEAGVLGRVAG